jgi:ATP sulfurylase
MSAKMQVPPPDVKELFVPADKLAEKTAYADTLQKLNINKLSMEWLQVLAEGWASPLNGFMREKEFLQVLHFNTILQPDGERTNQSVPIVLPCTTEEKAWITGSDAIALVYEGKTVAILNKPEVSSMKWVACFYHVHVSILHASRAHTHTHTHAHTHARTHTHTHTRAHTHTHTHTHTYTHTHSHTHTHTHTHQVFDAIKEERCSRTFGLHHTGHPYVAQIYADGDYLVGGDLEVLGEI